MAGPEVNATVIGSDQMGLQRRALLPTLGKTAQYTSGELTEILNQKKLAVPL